MFLLEFLQGVWDYADHYTAVLTAILDYVNECLVLKLLRNPMDNNITSQTFLTTKTVPRYPAEIAGNMPGISEGCLVPWSIPM